jgi:hypothetical protein
MFLRPYADNRMSAWVASAFMAQRMKEGREYTVCNNRFIAPVDYTSSGAVETNKKWGDGLHQFLEMKHELPLTPMPCVTNFMSNVAFFQRYISDSKERKHSWRYRHFRF